MSVLTEILDRLSGMAALREKLQMQDKVLEGMQRIMLDQQGNRGAAGNPQGNAGIAEAGKSEVSLWLCNHFEPGTFYSHGRTSTYT